VSLSRRCLITQQNFRLLSSEVQPRSENENKLQTPIEPEKDKLYSRLEIELKGIEPEVMKSYGWYATRAAEHLGITVGKW
jgi:small subunit ribosomal protein S10